MHIINQIILAGGLMAAVQTVTAVGPIPVSLQNVPIPPVPGLLDGANPIVVDKAAAIALGKALFWDQSLGSDGQACASCHFSAGADGRIKNQINPGQKSPQPSGQDFDTLPSGRGGPNHTLTAEDFPLHRFSKPLNNSSEVLFSTDDVIGSAGTFGGEFQGASQFTGAADQCKRAPDELFNLGHIGTRRVAARNAPSVINAVFNHRQFWDGRANNVFNGSSPWGPRDPDAGVWVKLNARTVVKQRLNLVNSSLASQAVEPPVFNDVEVGCNRRSWPDIGRKLLLRQPLQYQQVDAEDSVLGGLSQSTCCELKPGLKTTYRALITKAFNPQYWSYSGLGAFGAPAVGGTPYNQMEANFALFFGLAIQLYESTLISDQAPLDLSPVDANHLPTWSNVVEATPAETEAKIASLKHGLDLFVNNHCSNCHVGPTLTLAALTTNSTLLTPTPGATFGPPDTPIAYGPDAFGPNQATLLSAVSAYPNPLTREFTALSGPKLNDLGFANIGVTRPVDDLGIGASDPFGNPLSYTAQYLHYLLGESTGVVDLPVETVRACDFLVSLAVNAELDNDYTFQPGDGVQLDGSREGAARDHECRIPNSYYIPTVAAARASRDGPKLATAITGAVKIPGLRNVELTGPYMHNGGLATLEQVIQFYVRHGNFRSDFQNREVLIPGQPLTTQKNLTDLTNFLKALTDERVRYQKAPFDHPQLSVIHGHVGDSLQVAAGNALGANLAKDELLEIPAVGANGTTKPIRPFLNLPAVSPTPTPAPPTPTPTPPPGGQGGVAYNINGWDEGNFPGASGNMPGIWIGGPAPNYTGTLNALWYVDLVPGSTQVVSMPDAIQRAGADPLFELMVGPRGWAGSPAEPDKGYSHGADVGLLKLETASTVTITLSAYLIPEQPNDIIKPGFSLFRGWDTGTTTNQLLSGTYIHNQDNPFGSVGLSYLNGAGAGPAETSVSLVFTNLAAGEYTLALGGNAGGVIGYYKVNFEAEPVTP